MAVIVGVDGSDQSMRVLDWAIEEARLRGQPVVALLVYGSPPLYYPQGIPGGVNEEVAERVREGAERRLAELLASYRAGADGVVIESEVIEHPQPAHALTDRAGEDDLLVVGSRGLGGFRGLLLGSVSQQVAQHARCPVVIVHGKD